MPEHRRAAIAECLTRINYSIIYGNLEMDLKDGEIRVRTIVESNQAIADPMIDRAISSNLNSANRYFGPLMSIAFGNASPDTILDMVERSEKTNLQ